MAKKAKKSIIEEEMETMKKQNEQDRILDIVKAHARNISRTKMQYLEEDENERYTMYSNIEAAFDILLDDLRKEGYAV